MKQTDLDSWEDFETEVTRLRATRAEADRTPGSSVSELLFRGQSDHSWSLDTTLERRVAQTWSFSQYFRLVSVIKPQIETFTGNRWKLPDLDTLRKWTAEYGDVKRSLLPGYDYFVFLRHHGFPSPLLDWTRSPYVAAHFAFADAHSSRVALFVYWEYAGHAKTGSSGSPQIVSFGPYIRSHSRHFLQQSEYTIGCRFREDGWWYGPHEDVVALGSTTQDRFWKFTIPATERLKVLRILEDHNLNAFSLFQTDESLLETISLRELELHREEL